MQMFAVPMMMLAAMSLATVDEPTGSNWLQARGAADAMVQLAAGDEATPEDLKRVDQAFSQLAAGDESAVIAMLDRRVAWQATAARELKPAANLSQKGAGLYLKAMGEAIRSGKYKLELLGIEPVRGGVMLTSRWVTPEGVAECANLVQLLKGRITAVVERAM
jgi:hypothetical protein